MVNITHYTAKYSETIVNLYLQLRNQVLVRMTVPQHKLTNVGVLVTKEDTARTNNQHWVSNIVLPQVYGVHA